MERNEFAIRLAMVALAIAGALVLYQLRYLLLLLFAAVLVALALHAAADPMIDRLGMRRGLALSVSGLLGLLVPLSVVFAFGSEIVAQMDIASQRIPASARELAALLEQAGVPPQLLAQLSASQIGGNLAGLVGQILANAAQFIGAAVLAFVTGAYLAAQPSSYREGILAFVPRHRRASSDDLCRAICVELKHWLVAQSLVMAMVGTLTGLGAWALGVPAPIALGILAGLLEVVPYLGPILASVPAAALGLSVGVDVAVLMLIWIFVVQQLEGLLLTPLVLRKAVRLPPAASLLALIAAGILLGSAGVLLAAPAAVVGYVIYRRFRLRNDAVSTLSEGSTAGDGSVSSPMKLGK